MRSFRKRRTRLSLEIYYLHPVDIKRRVSLLPQVRSGCFRGENLSAGPSCVAIPTNFPVSFIKMTDSQLYNGGRDIYFAHIEI